jgi:hypothetical protein
MLVKMAPIPRIEAATVRPRCTCQAAIKVKTIATSKADRRACRTVTGSVKLKRLLPNAVIDMLRLIVLVKDKVLNNEGIYTRSHEAQICILWRAHNRLAADVE